MVDLKRHVFLLGQVTEEKRREALNHFLNKPFKGTPESRVSRLDYNARLFTRLRKEGLWPPSDG